jgi:hypothetical protein
VTERLILPQRRGCETFELPWGGLTRGHLVSFGRFSTGRISEVFIGAGRSGEAIEAMARDAAILMSLNFQHEVLVESIAHAITRDSQNNPLSIIGAVADQLLEREKGL